MTLILACEALNNIELLNYDISQQKYSYIF